ncbi:carbonic anhydrase family protein [Holzapfeliella sp. He02]|uniref:Carbonic anhydrase n=1 Tax=Holzapfeliella saturejae TaxID=3082953 RepID=A0ABU8SEU7_9LACO
MKHLNYQRQSLWQKPTDVLCQSPISLTQATSTAIKGQFVTIEFDCVTTRKDQIVGEQFISQGLLNLFGNHWHLERFHFHEHSEHRIENHYHDIEIHFVFKHDEAILVVAVLGDVTIDSPSKITRLFENNYARFELSPLFPDKSNYYSYQGSLTTPPFEQTVQWVVMADSIQISASDLATIKASYPSNYRNEQPRQKRKIYYHITP